MAKLLKFGVGYIPNKEVFDRKLNQKVTMNYAILSLYLDDKSAPAVLPDLQNILKNNVSLNSKNKDTINITIPEDKFDVFINGKLMGRILSVVEQITGYVADTNSISSLSTRFQHAKDEVNNADPNSVATISNKYIQDLIAGLEKDINDPRFQQIMKGMHVFSYSNGFTSQASSSYNDSDVLFKETKLTVDNIIRILAQWNKAGRSGIPTYLATENQWDRFFGGKIRQDAVKLYAVRPDNVAGVSTRTVANQLGIDPNISSQSGAHARALHSIARGGGMDKWRGKQSAYALVCYYDVSDVDGVDPNTLTGSTANSFDPNSVTTDPVDADAVAADQANNPKVADTNDIVNNSPTMTEDILRKKLIKLANDTKNNGIKLAINMGGTIGGLRYVIEHLKEITRDHDIERKKNTVEQVLFIVLSEWRLFEDERVSLLRNNKVLDILKPSNNFGKQSGPNLINQKLITDLWAYAYNVISLLNEIKESYENGLTLAKVINYLGYTVDEFKRMPKTEEEAYEILRGVRENFIKTFNNLLIK